MKWGRRGHSVARARGIIRLCGSIYGLTIDEERKPRKRTGSEREIGGGQVDDRYREQLSSAAGFLASASGSLERSLVVNLGPAWQDPDIYEIFAGNVIDLPDICYERPPGVGTLPLDILFTLCSWANSWITLNDKNVVLLHHRSSSAGSIEKLRFIAGCFMAYAGNYEDTKSIANLMQEIFPEQKNSLRHKADSWPKRSLFLSSKSIVDLDESGQHQTRALGCAQRLYGQYVVTVLYAKSLPPQQKTALHIKKVTFGGLDSLRRGMRSLMGMDDRMGRSLLQPVLVIYQRGEEIFAGRAIKKDDAIEFSVGENVAGDVVLGLWYVKDHIAGWEPPVAAFSFHTSFMEPGILRVASPKVDVDRRLSRLKDEKLYLEVALAETNIPVDKIVKGGTDVLDLQQMRRAWEFEMAERQHGGKVPLSETNRAALTKSVQDSKQDEGQCTSTSENSNQTEAAESRSTRQGAVVGMDDAPSTPTTCEAPGRLRAGSAGSVDSSTEAGPSEYGLSISSEPVPGPSSRGGGQRRGPPPPPPPPAPPPPPLRRLPPTVPSKNRGQGVKKLRNFYWTKTTKHLGTVWSELPGGRPLPPGMDNLLEDLFSVESKKPGCATPRGATTPRATPRRSTEVPRKKKGVAQVVSTTRANNVSIMMTRFRGFNGGLHGMLHTLLSGKGLTHDQLSLIHQIAPSEEEIAALKAFHGSKEDLSKPEQILLEMSRVPRLKAKAKALMFTHQWEPVHSETMSALRTVQVACQQVRESQHLRHVFEWILIVGNALNKGTHRGDAYGIRVESLLTLRDYKISGDKKKSSADSSRRSPSPGLHRIQSSDLVGLLDPRCKLSAESVNVRTLLDFAVLIVHTHEQKVDYNPARYLRSELGDLVDAGPYLEGAVRDLQDEIDSGLSKVEDELQAICGQPWEVVKAMGEWPGASEKKGCDSDSQANDDLTSENDFGKVLFDFLNHADGPRAELQEENAVTEEHLKRAATWLGEPEDGNPRTTLKHLLAFCMQFDTAYKSLIEFL